MAQYYVYIMTNRSGTLYVIVTPDLVRKMYEHKNKLVHGFTSRYNIDRLILFEQTDDFESAVTREKQIKGWTRKKKIDLIRQSNETWRDLSEGWLE
ncbi:MAG: GIY-YIG nuclease family protein [SAR202 cluster bacterium]|jgi:putative endonuclease|nr:GIY-YIG nuclease family protein [SAR202 cluster bacterium]MDP7102141.1 GIY-YIG nuclease family protein [SAR202 cluster bacterium]MDP7224068.1 GIY-YIG nuclease family protein [SAR202 cluster bacterium]HJO83402.1 GIY-YIG nuclease family protein [SAR202 cluster bacterium]|tara:strand:- start:515 stop:802 length:288 start_codon:yes stop_codon:yes gene_type:complete